MVTANLSTLNNVKNTFTSAFVLDKAKLSRILDILEKRFLEEKLEFNPTYEVTFLNGKNIKLSGADELLELDNTVKNPINALSVYASESSLVAESDDYSGFKRTTCTLEFDSTNLRNVSLSVSSTDTKGC